MVSGDQWPLFVYAGYTYDSEDPWNGLFRSPLLVCVRSSRHCYELSPQLYVLGIQAHLHLPQLRGEGAKGNAFGKCTDSWYDTYDKSIHRICRHSG